MSDDIVYKILLHNQVIKLAAGNGLAYYMSSCVEQEVFYVHY